MTILATLFPLLCYFAYGLIVPMLERVRPSLSVIMSHQRRRWVYNASRRESPFDAILSGNIMSSVSFMASTSVLLVLAVFAVFGQLPTLLEALKSISLDRIYSISEIQFHLVVMLSMFALAFFAFTLSLRQFNHFCIMLGAIDHSIETSPDEIDAIARINTLGAQNFNNGIRAYYFSVGTVAWFAAEWMSIAWSVLAVGFLIYREFFSSAHRVAVSAAIVAQRREQARTL